MTAFQPLRLILANGEGNCPPPLLTKKSTLPKVDNEDDTKSLKYIISDVTSRICNVRTQLIDLIVS